MVGDAGDHGAQQHAAQQHAAGERRPPRHGCGRREQRGGDEVLVRAGARRISPVSTLVAMFAW